MHHNHRLYPNNARDGYNKLEVDPGDRCRRQIPDVDDNRLSPPDLTGKLEPCLWNRFYTKEPHYRDCNNRMSYTRGRSKAFSSFRHADMSDGDFHTSDRFRRPDFRMSDSLCRPDFCLSDRFRKPDFGTSDSHNRLLNEETGIDSIHHMSDTRGRPDHFETNKLETDASDKHECSFICFWRIENFCIDETSQCCSINSQMFDVLMINNSQWHLRVEHLQYETLSLYLYNQSEQMLCDIHIELSVLTTDGWNTVKDSIHNQFRSDNQSIGAKLINWRDQFQVKTHLPNDCLTVSCHISIQSTLFNPVQFFMPSRMISHKLVIHSPILEFSDLNPSEVVNFPIPSIFLEHLPTSDEVETKSTQTESAEYCDSFEDSENLLNLFKEKTFCYVTLRTASKDFAVHKALLCAKSPVFNAMFRGTTKENNSSIVDIDDIDGDCLSLLLQFLYLEPLRDLKWEDAAKLYYAADKYQVSLLRTECRSVLKNKLSIRNICDAFILADMHKDEDLQESAEEYFCVNSKVILCSPEWTEFLFKRVDLASKVLYRLGENM